MISEKFVYRIYLDLLRYNYRIGLIPKEDVLQEIRIAGLDSDKDSIYKRSSSQVHRLLAEYGFSEKKGKDNFYAFYEDRGFSEKEQSILDQIERFYLNENRTAREIAAIYDIDYNNKLQKILHQCFPKNLGKGGARKNAGNNKFKNN